MDDIFIRFLVGGLVVSLFSSLADVLRPKSFAGLFGAAPSIALATVGLTIEQNGKTYAAVEKVLQNDKRAIFSAAAHVQRAPRPQRQARATGRLKGLTVHQ